MQSTGDAANPVPRTVRMAGTSGWKHRRWLATLKEKKRDRPLRMSGNNRLDEEQRPDQDEDDVDVPVEASLRGWSG